MTATAPGYATTMIIFGASGDLMRRKLGPALFRICRRRQLPPEVKIIGFARTELDDDGFRAYVRGGVDEFAGPVDDAAWARFAARLHYVTGDVTVPADFALLGRELEQLESGPAHRLYYLAMAPRFFGPAVEGLGASGMAACEAGGPRRDIVIEKPFGRDATSADALNTLVHSVFAEEQVFRIDHYLGKETAQNILYFRFANAIFDPLLNRSFVDHVQISVTETGDIGHRGGYYDQAGVWRDMFQNHLLQLLALVAMEAPVAIDAVHLRDEKLKVLAAIRPVDAADIVAAQYAGYTDAEDVASGSRTPTYGAVKLMIDNWRWSGVPFYLRSGKALAVKGSEITVAFKRPVVQLFGTEQSPRPNVLSICIQPDEGVHLSLDAKVPGDPVDINPVDLEFHYRTSFPGLVVGDAYERLLLDALRGDAALFTRSDEIKQAWGLFDPVIAIGEDASSLPPDVYQPGSSGPASADALLAREGHRWLAGCSHEEH